MPRIVKIRLKANGGSFAIAKTMRECCRERIPPSTVSQCATKGDSEAHANLVLDGNASGHKFIHS